MKRCLLLVILLASGLLISARADYHTLIRPGRVDFIPAENLQDSIIMVNAVTSPPFEEYFYYSTDLGFNWEEWGAGGSSDTTLTKVFSFAADGDSAAFYMLFDCEWEFPNALVLEMIRPFGLSGEFIDIAPNGVKAHYFAGCTDHLGPEHWIYICVVDTEPSQPERALIFQLSTDYGNDWFPSVGSYPLIVRDPYLASGRGRYIYFAGVAGENRDSLVIWTNKSRLNPSQWVYNWIDTEGDEIETPILACAFNAVDSFATVWCAYARNRNNSGNWDIEYVYSTDGGINWSEPLPLAAAPDTEERYFDLKPCRYNQSNYVALAYIRPAGAQNDVFLSWADAIEPTNWNPPMLMNELSAAKGRNLRPRVCYLPFGLGIGVIYAAADSSGCYWTVPFTGITESQSPQIPNSSRLKVIPSVGKGSFQILGAKPGEEIFITDVSGRIVFQTRAQIWDGRDKNGSILPPGVYFIRTKDAGVKPVVILGQNK